ncbi:MAG: hypothetical protein CMH46_05090 [Muricauda sp.]|nr:hypothetical protein [Allomuricauda sp.]
MARTPMFLRWHAHCNYFGCGLGSYRNSRTSGGYNHNRTSFYLYGNETDDGLIKVISKNSQCSQVFFEDLFPIAP